MLYRFKTAFKRILPEFLLDGYHFGLAFLAAIVSGFPSRKLKVIGITGTNGKSTCVEMLSRILEEAGLKTASLSSIRFRILDQEEPNLRRLTMPGRFFVQRFLSRAARAGCQYAILEVTSEGIKQHRHRFINFKAAVLTNLTPEHIESHGGFEKYRQAKGQLFEATKNIHILNLDDDNVDYFLEFEAKEKWGYGLKTTNQAPNPKGRIQDTQYKIQNTIRAENIQTTTNGSKFTVNSLEFSLKLLGEFNVSNALAAIATAQSQSIGLEVCQRALEKMEGLPGRLEEVVREPFRVFVDYAFTPNALHKVYETLRNSKLETPASRVSGEMRNSKLICVFGACGGGRDKWKRPVLGEIARRSCDQIILTNEDPYDEDPSQIIDQIAQGIENISLNQLWNQRQSVVYKIIDRREAINKALNLAQPGDVIIITGKGCEPSICLERGQQIPWDDRQVVKEEYGKIQSHREALK